MLHAIAWKDVNDMTIEEKVKKKTIKEKKAASAPITF